MNIINDVSPRDSPKASIAIRINKTAIKIRLRQ